MQALVFAAMLAAPSAMPGAPVAAPLVAPPAPAEPIPLSVWRPTDAAGFEHLQSGLRCPETLGKFHRIQVTAFSPFGTDVGCGYNTGDAALTIYMTWAANVDDAFGQAKASVIEAQAARHPRLISETRETSEGLDWRRAEYTLDGVMRSDIWLTNLQGWQFKFRASYPNSAADDVAEAIALATTAVRDSAGRHLALCEKSRPPRRAGKATKVKAGDPAVLAGLIGASPAASDGTLQDPQPVFCVEDGYGEAGRGFLLWRGVTPDGEDALVDQLTVMTMGPPPTLDIALDSIGNLISVEQRGGKTRSRWIATMSRDKSTAIYGYFDERPSAKVAASLMGRILDGKAVAIGSFSTDGKTINVNLPSR